MISDLISESVMEPQCHLVVSPGIVKRRVSGTDGLYICAYEYDHLPPTYILVSKIKLTLFLCF